MTTICVCGGRHYHKRNRVFAVLDMAMKTYPNVFIKNGAAQGADKLASEWAKSRNCPFLEYPAKWSIYGRRAGPERNKEMLKSGFDLLIAFPGGTGTAHMVKITKEAGIPVIDLREE